MGFLLDLTLFGSTIWALIVLSLWIIICFISDVKENGYPAAIFLLIFGILFYFRGDGTFIMIYNKLSWTSVLSYFSIGLLYSFIRVFFYGRKEQQKYKKSIEENPNSFYHYKVNRNIKEHIFRWWFMWPISMIVWFFKDMIKDIYEWIYKRISKVFNIILTLGIKSVK